MTRTLLIAFFGTMILFSCNKRKIKDINNILISKDWQISALKVNGTDYTHDYMAYTFQFTSNKSIQAYKTGILDANGSWNLAKENDSNNDGFFEQKHLELSINLPSYYSTVSDDWDVVSYSETQLVLNKENGDQLTLIQF